MACGVMITSDYGGGGGGRGKNQKWQNIDHVMRERPLKYIIILIVDPTSSATILRRLLWKTDTDAIQYTSLYIAS